MDSDQRYNADDWLKFNDLLRGDVLRLLRAAQIHTPRQEIVADGISLYKDIDEDVAWHLAANAIAAFLPTIDRIVGKIRDEAPHCLSPLGNKSKVAFARDRGRGTLPFISCNYDRSPAGLLCVVHEFAHAVQILASDHALMPPVAREVCAFLGQYALIDWLKERQPALADALRNAQCEEDRRYLGSDAEALAVAMRGDGAAYHYRWNYPIARWLADRIWSEGDRVVMARLFASGAQAPALLHRFLDCGMINRPNPFPFLPQPREREQPAVQIYRQMGTIALLDLEDRREEGQENIDDYYAFLLEHMRSGQVLIRLDDANRPTGYATWDGLIGDCVKLTRQCAPFGDQSELFEALKNHFPTGTSISPFANPVSAVCTT